MSAGRGADLIAGQERTTGVGVVIGVDPCTGDELVPAAHEATADVACREAAADNPLGIPRRVDGDLRLPPAGGRRDMRENRA